MKMKAKERDGIIEDNEITSCVLGLEGKEILHGSTPTMQKFETT